ncbi:hypothetical protein [Streptomyces sp. NPDC059166]|uniref:hypothetical protein n=1 Tax=Streptomyces sp. NPDC059166 TaxID=3346752 RepID=UPI00368D34CF
MQSSSLHPQRVAPVAGLLSGAALLLAAAGALGGLPAAYADDSSTGVRAAAANVARAHAGTGHTPTGDDPWIAPEMA